MFEVIISTEAQAFYAAAQPSLAKKLARCFTHLERNPGSGNNAKRLTGGFAGYYRYRVGDWRVIYRINDARRQVYVDSIANRGEVYE